MSPSLDLLQPRNLSRLIELQAAQRPDAVAVENAGRLLTYAELNQEIMAAASALSAHALRPGAVVAIQVAAPYRHWLATLAALRLGLCSISMRVGDRAQDKLAPALIVNDQTDLSAPVGGGVPIAASLTATPARLFQSSGTTGDAKTIMLDLAHLSRRLIGNADTYRAEASTRALPLIGPGTTSGFALPLLTWAAGGTVIFAGELTARDLIAAAARATLILASPVAIAALIDKAPPSAFTGQHRALFLAGARLPASLRTRLLERLGERITIMYGAMEIGGGCRGDSALIDRTPGAVGFPRTGTEVEVVNDANERLPPGTEGNVRMRSDLMAHAYLNDPDSSARNFRDGWFYPGDRGVLASDGMLSITGRIDDIMNIGGFKLHPTTVEETLGQVPGISALAALTLPGATGENRFFIALVPQADVDWRLVEAHVKSALRRFPAFRAVRLPELPYNDAGKVDRRRLAWQISSQLAAENRAPDAAGPPPSTVPADPEALSAANLPHFAERMAARHPTRVAAESNGVPITFAEMANDIAAVAVQLATARGDRHGAIGHHFRDQYLNWLVILAGLRLGVTTVTLSAAAPKIELSELNVSLFATDVPDLLHNGTVAAVSISRAAGSAPRVVPPTPKSQWARLMQSSGTTGARKITALDVNGIAVRLHADFDRYDVGSETRAHTLIAANSAIGFNLPLITWAHGACVILTATRTLEATATALERATVAALSPRDLAIMIDRSTARSSPNRHRHFFVGGGSLSQSLRTAALATICNRITLCYGAIEISSACRGDSAIIARHPGAVGFARDGIEIEIVNNQGTRLPAGTEGRVRMRAATLVPRYMDNDALSKAFFRDGWFYPGDLGVQFADGLLAITGRSGDVINLGGTKLAPALIETAIGRVRGLADVAVTSIKNTDIGEQLVIAAVGAPDCDWRAARSSIDTALSGFPPRLIVEVDAIPRGEMGKVDRRLLAEKVFQTLVARAQKQQPALPPTDHQQSLTPQGRSLLLGGPASHKSGP